MTTTKMQQYGVPAGLENCCDGTTSAGLVLLFS